MLRGGRQGSAGAQAKDARGQDAGDRAEALVVGQGPRFILVAVLH
jgi:hypothetical protein